MWMLALSLAVAGYQQPPDDVAQILDAKRPPSLTRSPDDAWILELDRPEMRTIAELAAPKLELAGMELDPVLRAPAGSYAYTGMTLRPFGRHDRVTRTPIDLGDSPQVRNVDWHDDSDKIAFTQDTDAGVELWVLDLETQQPRKLLGPRLNNTYGAPCDWLPGDEGLLCKVVPESQGPPPADSPVPDGPRIEESLGRVAPARTYQNLLQDEHDEALFEYYLTSELAHVALDGTVTTVLPAQLLDEVNLSPDAEWMLVHTLHGPWSRSVPVSRFPRKAEVHSRTDDARVVIADLPLADDVPTAFGSVRTGKRTVGWRSDQPATLYTVEALDGGDAGVEADKRDRVSLWPAPFDAAPTVLIETELRFGGIAWGDANLALVYESWWKARRTRTWQIDPADPEKEPVLHWDRSSQDRYSDPGSPLYTRTEWGTWVLRVDDGQLWLSGRGYSPEGVHPFLDRYDLGAHISRRVWQSRDPYYETVEDVMPDGKTFLTRRQSADEPPATLLHKLGRGRAMYTVHQTEDWAPAFAEVTKKVIRYQRADGVELSATVYLPPGYEESDGPLPTVFWAYPNEFKRKSDAGQVTKTSNTFTRPGGSSHLFFLLQGWAVIDDPTLPIVGEGDEEPNDTFIAQLTAGAEAAVKTTVELGITDPERTVVGGHSYGAFMVAHLLAHTDLFKAGIARSGAYNRTLTPFGFQGEERSYWEATDLYVTMSPFTHAAKIDEPILLIHGADDSNSGTYPLQSERLFEALKGLGGTVRWVQLPYEDHGYRARESVGHVLWEMFDWAETHTAAE